MLNSKRKGTAGEHELEKLLHGYGIRAYRNDQIFKGGKGNPDVSAEIAGIQVHFEVKRLERLNISAAMAQAEQDALPGHLPAVAHRRNREKWMLTVPLVLFLDILKEYIPDETLNR